MSVVKLDALAAALHALHIDGDCSVLDPLAPPCLKARASAAALIASGVLGDPAEAAL